MILFINNILRAIFFMINLKIEKISLGVFIIFSQNKLPNIYKRLKIRQVCYYLLWYRSLLYINRRNISIEYRQWNITFCLINCSFKIDGKEKKHVDGFRILPELDEKNRITSYGLWMNFYMKKSERVFLIVVVKELEHFIINLSLAYIEVGANIYKKFLKI